MAEAQNQRLDDDDFPAFQRASDWFVALRDDPANTALHQAFDLWVAQSPLHAQEWADILRVHHLLGASAPHLTNIYSDSAHSPPSQRHRTHHRLWAGVGLALAASLCLALMPELWLNLTTDHTTGTGRTESFTLSDGSQIVLGPESAVKIDYSDEMRRISLVKGSAYFEVTPDPARPFQVRADDVRTTVLGTGFDVNRLKDKVSVGVRHGRVRVDQGDAGTHLEGGKTLSLSAAGAQVETLPPEQIATWTEGHLIARDMPVDEAVDRLRPYHKGLIIIRGKKWTHQTLTGLYRLNNPKAALEAIASAHQGQVQQISPWIIVLSE